MFDFMLFVFFSLSVICAIKLRLVSFW